MKEGSPQAAGNPATTLVAFVKDLLQQGSVRLSDKIQPFSAEDKAEVAQLVAQYHSWDAFHMPLQAPAYDAAAAAWAAEYLYRALQFLLLRNLGPELIEANMRPFEGAMTPEAAYSADLALRNLPMVHGLARSLSPSDPLVLNMEATARQWPFSAVGIPVESPAELPDHPSLRLAYADRVIAARDRRLSQSPSLNGSIQVALGAHAKLFWPDFEPLAIAESNL
jgi:hypothetical protein